MSTYYEYRDVKVMIAHKLMNMEGWKVYGYKEDRSDSMTDYYDPANWGGVAEKNGYILCVNVYGAREAEEIRKYNYSGFSYDHSITEKIKKLENMTVEHGASEQEEKSAKLSIERLQKKAEENTENQNKYIVTGIIPGHQANPPKMNWHIEKDGIIIAKGNGILKFASVYYDIDRNCKERTAEEIRNSIIENNYGRSWIEDKEELEKSVKYQLEEQEKTLKLIAGFNKFINKLDTTCGGLLGEGDGTIYEKVTVTEYKKENRVFETETGEIKEGQCFIVKTSFNYGHSKGYVYRIHVTEYEGRKSYHAVKLNGKLTKECNGTANQSNHWYITDNFIRWFEKGSLAWCEIKEVKTPYEVEKVIKKTINNGKASTKADKKTSETTENIDINNYTYDIAEDTDTRDNSKIWVVKVREKVEDFSILRAEMKKVDAYYSKFKHGFIFKYNPIEVLNGGAPYTENKEEEQVKVCNVETELSKEEVKKPIEFDILEDKSPFDNKKLIYVAKVKNELSKQEFTEVKQKLAKLNGFYSSLKDGFIFKYDPKEKLII